MKVSLLIMNTELERKHPEWRELKRDIKIKEEIVYWDASQLLKFTLS